MDDNGDAETYISPDSSLCAEDPMYAQGIRKKRKERDEVQRSIKQQEEEKYAREIQEQQYKRLMHLLNKSKFYASYIANKIDSNLANNSNKAIKKNGSDLENDPNTCNKNIPPSTKRGRKKGLKVSKDVQKKIHLEQQKLNWNKYEIEKSSQDDPKRIVNMKTEIKAEEKPIVQIEELKYFNGELRDYQKEGFLWLKVLYENGVNGILADEMGLGKTIQVIALLCYLLEKCQDGPYLLIVPLSTVPNWLIEFEKFAPKLPVVLYHGSRDERLLLRSEIKKKHKMTPFFSTLPIVLTTYEVPLNDKRVFTSINWKYIVVDEGHRIKNHECQLARILRTCKSMNRLLLTGTPLQNNLAELWSLLNFLLPEIFDDLALFESWFDAEEFEHGSGTEKVLKLEEEKQILSSLREILKPFMLRRVKSDVCLEVPPKKEVVVYAPLTKLQHDLYKAVLDRNIDILSKLEEKPDECIQYDKRPKRKCTLSFSERLEKYGSKFSIGSLNDESTTEIRSDRNTIDSKNKSGNESLSVWKQYTDVTERNRDFLVRIQIGNVMLYKKIVNHPHLIHCPLGPDGLPKVDEELIQASGKLMVLDAMLAKLKNEDHKVLIFSTMTTILDVLEDYLSLRKYEYVRLDGSTSLEDRKENIQRFNTDPETFLFLISTKAGGVGLNLNGADTVIIYDSHWNPQVDIQAMARCHRIGQTRPVMIYKLCTKGTIDERIITRAEAKRVLEKAVISKNVEMLNTSDKENLLTLRQLLESKENETVTTRNEVFTEDELNKLLDRSELYKMQNSS